MDSKKRNIYLIFIVITIFFAIMFSSVFIQMGSSEFSSPEGNFITLGGNEMEWLFAILILPVVVFISGLLAINIISNLFLGSYVKSLAKKNKVGLVPLKEIDGKLLFLRIWIRGLILGFFMANICYSLSGQESIVQFMRSVNPGSTYIIPDPETMLQLIWILAIPCTLILVPIWMMIDSGLVSTKKLKGVEFEATNLSSASLYKIIKGYAGIGFAYNFIVMIISWVIEGSKEGSNDASFILQILSPLIIISMMFPLVIYIDTQRAKIRERVEGILKKLDIHKELVMTVELKDKK